MKMIRILCHYENEEKLPISSLGLPSSLLEALAELGSIEIADGYITPPELQRACRAARLAGALHLDMAGAAIIAELLERMEEMQEELNRLRRGR